MRGSKVSELLGNGSIPEKPPITLKNKNIGGGLLNQVMAHPNL